MANIAVINLAGAQHVVRAGDKFEVNKLENELEKNFVPEVLLSTDGENVLFNDGKVEAVVREQKRGEKLYVIRFKAKSRYRRRTGHRQYVSLVEIVSINGEKKAAKAVVANELVEKTAVVSEVKPKVKRVAKKAISTKEDK